MKTRRFYALLVMTAGILGSTACGPLPTSRLSTSYASEGASYLNSGGTHSSTTDEYATVDAPNVEPEAAYTGGGLGQYRVRKNTSAPMGSVANNTIKISGKPFIGKSFCVFPARYRDQYAPLRYFNYLEVLRDDFSSTAAISDALANLREPKLQCRTLSNTDDELTLSFEATDYFDGVFIVDQSDAAQMKSCLKFNQYWSCPANWSWGIFR